MTGSRLPRAAIAAAAAAAAALALCAAPRGGGVPAGVAALGPDHAAAADCVPVQRSKTVVKRVKVKRHGKVVKVKRKRKKRWTVCVPPAPPTPQCDVPASALGVTARDEGGANLSFTLSRTCVTAGSVTVELNNQGEDPHNVYLRPLAGPDPGYSIPSTGPEPFELDPGMQESASFNLAPGEWYLTCELVDGLGAHRDRGMSAHLTAR
jgi:hypothetical protein